MNWHSLPEEQVFSLLGSSKKGLSADQAATLLLEVGKNELQEQKRKTAWHIWWNQFTDFMILILIAAAILSGIIGDLTDTFIIIAIVILNAILGFIQEYRAERALLALKQLAALRARVLRDGREHEIAAEDLVPGDVVLLEAGNVVPADVRLFEIHGLKADESSLTGESVPVEKKTGIVPEVDVPVGDRFNMAFKTTVVTAGKAKGVVVATGMQTQIGQIARLLQEEESRTPLQIRMADFGKKLSYIILMICALLFGIGLMRGEELFRMLLLSVSLAVAAIPEALPALITIALARGAKQMVAGNALVRKLPAMEALGSVTFICSDKTGTLTQNRMEVVTEVETHTGFTPNGLPLLHWSMAVSHELRWMETKGWVGDPTERAMVLYAEKKYGSDQIRQLLQKSAPVAEVPFDSDRKLMTTFHRHNGNYLAITKGAVESIAERLTDRSAAGVLMEQATVMSRQGQRVLAFAGRFWDTLPDSLEPAFVERDLFSIGLVGMIDPIRPEVPQAIAECRSAGIVPVMITGDHPETATAIATDLGILQPGNRIITGKELAQMSPETLDEQVENIRTYARVSPEQKLHIVRALQRRKQLVAMTGDGVNDAPALRAANIGVAMGVAGSDVSKEAAHLILLDDNFATIVRAVREGRRIYDNIRKFVKYIMTCNSAEIWILFLAPLIGLPIPLLPIHILWINLVTDGLPGLALAAEKAERDVMARPPRRPDETLFAEGVGYHIIWVGLLMAAISLAAQALALHHGLENWQTIVFTVLTLSQLGHVMAIRSEKEFMFRRGLSTNPGMLITVLATFGIHLIVVYWPPANEVFHTQPLTLLQMLACTGAAAIIFHAVEMEKFVRHHLMRRFRR
ncbi:MAG: cation-translocating P-type ATPase [Chitinophagales bacterium]|nr:cation-translocating P-type ATPase [Chitinophagales bacterium]MDW8427932.1 cation-translocating P-type ATPase [Chitinophagales bacterium]